MAPKKYALHYFDTYIEMSYQVDAILLKVEFFCFIRKIKEPRFSENADEFQVFRDNICVYSIMDIHRNKKKIEEAHTG